MNDGTDVYENDLIRYYSSDMTKIQFGIAKEYNDFENRITVSAVVPIKINPVNIIETYRESDWKKIDLTRDDGKVEMTVYPFREAFTISEKKNRENRIAVDLPYTITGKTTLEHLLDVGKDGFLNQLSATMKGIINNNIMAFSFDSVFSNGTSYSPKLVVKLPYQGKFKYTMNQLFMVGNKDYLYERILTDIKSVIYSTVFKDSNKIDTQLYDGQREYSKIRIPLPYTKKTSTKFWPFVYSPDYAYTKVITQMREIVNSEVVEFKSNLKVSLPYTTESSIKFWDYVNSPDYAEQAITTEALRVINEDIVQEVSLDGSTVVNLPYVFRGQYSFKELMNKGTSYMDGDIRADIRTTINSKLIKKYYYCNGTTKISGLPWIDKINMKSIDLLDYDADGLLSKITGDLEDIVNDKANKFSSDLVFPWIDTTKIRFGNLMSSGKVTISNNIIDYIIQLIDSKMEAFQYGTIITSGKFVMPFYLTGYRLNEISDTGLRNEIINNFESLLAIINSTSSTIKTYRDTDTTAVGKRLKVEIPLVEHLELLADESNSTKNVYRCFITNHDELTRAYIIVSNNRFNKDIIIASPHIDSENSVVLETFENNENPLKYKTDYLKYLVDKNKKDVIDMVSRYNESPYDEGVVYV